MNRNSKRVPAMFGPETRFEVTPVPSAPFRARQAADFETLKHQLLRARLQEGLDAEFQRHLQLAATEAEALAWVTPYPLLVFPVLFQEKTEAVLARAERQEQVRQLSRELLAV